MKRLALTAVLALGGVARADVPSTDEPFSIQEEHRLSLSVPHHYAHAEVVERLGYLFDYWKKRFNISSQWRGDRVYLSGSIYGIKIEALFDVSDSQVVGVARDPGWPWRGKVVAYVDAKLKKYLHPTYDEP